MTGARLRGQVAVEVDGGRLILHDGHHEVAFEGAAWPPELAASIARTRSIEVGCAEAGVPAQLAEQIGAAVNEAGLLLEPELMGELIPLDVAERYVLRLLDSWVAQAYDGSFWYAAREDKARANLLYGWALENIHYTASVCAHLGMAIRCARDREVADKFVHHLSEEWDHPHLFVQSASALADGEQPARSCPLGATRALTLLLRHAATIHPLAYKTCVAVLERTASRIEQTRSYYHGLAEQQGLPMAAVLPLIAHAETDAEYDHLNSLAELRMSHPHVSREVLERALDLARTFVDLLYLWQRRIGLHYARFPLGRGAREDAAAYESWSRPRA